MSYVEIRQLSKRFDNTKVFENIDLDVEQGKICVLVGPSGCGKTTLLRAVAGLTHPDSGVIRIDGRDVTKVEAKHRGVGMVFQHYALFPNMSVEQNLAFGLEQKKLPRAEITKKVDGVIELMGLGPRAKARPAALSGGQKQRVALARALVLEPKLLLLDEPLSALDAQIRKRLRDELKRLQHDVGFTAIFVTHDQEEALMLGDVVAIMQAGKFVQIGAPADIYNRPASLAVANFVGDFNIFEPDTVKRLFGAKSKLPWAVRPEAIAGRLALVKSSMRISHEAIYRYVYFRSAQCDYWHRLLPQKKHRRGWLGKRGRSPLDQIRDRVSIAERPAYILKRRQPGHWETDIISFSRTGQNLLVAQERSSRFILIAKTASRQAAVIHRLLRSWFKALPGGLRRSLTQDNGTEFALHHRLRKPLAIKTYFCDPHSPWQKGGIENMNGRLRRSLPRSTDLATISHRQIRVIARRNNSIPRKCLGFRTSFEVFSAFS